MSTAGLPNPVVVLAWRYSTSSVWAPAWVYSLHSLVIEGRRAGGGCSLGEVVVIVLVVGGVSAIGGAFAVGGAIAAVFAAFVLLPSAFFLLFLAFLLLFFLFFFAGGGRYGGSGVPYISRLLVIVEGNLNWNWRGSCGCFDIDDDAEEEMMIYGNTAAVRVIGLL